jgi:prepilin-type N-terminal cleavage/methylation domain-containing protein
MRRRGFTLVEMLVVMTVGSVMFGIGVGVLHLLFQIERAGRDRVQQTRVLARLAEQFRADVNAAERPISAQGNRPSQWQFAMTGDRLVTYRALPGRLDRDEQVAGKLVRQESYALPTGCSATISVEREAKPPVASLIIARESTPLAAGHEMRVAARLGKDHRFTKPLIGGQ